MQGILQECFCNPFTGMFGVVVDGCIQFGLRRLEKNSFHAARRLLIRARA